MARFFNKNLKYVRSIKKISQQDLADKINVDRSTISRWENDEMDVTLENAIKIAEVLNVPFPDFLGRDLTIANNIDKNEFEKQVKELETNTGVKISYATEKELTQEDYLAINELVLNEIRSQKENN